MQVFSGVLDELRRTFRVWRLEIAPPIERYAGAGELQVGIRLICWAGGARSLDRA